ncbi:hypothetical protein EYF80_004308 [Liparis tanakae]|uniref:Uncharacterized protein n=1 Tax=Liparis tanakae TaxID=230148 RepID=A0A4Z2J538_9TELE|nr:hypothetical protein EYF80_004308 [Liparis tanakae]
MSTAPQPQPPGVCSLWLHPPPSLGLLLEQSLHQSPSAAGLSEQCDARGIVARTIRSGHTGLRHHEQRTHTPPMVSIRRSVTDELRYLCALGCCSGARVESPLAPLHRHRQKA